MLNQCSEALIIEWIAEFIISFFKLQWKKEKPPLASPVHGAVMLQCRMCLALEARHRQDEKGQERRSQEKMEC